MKFQTTGPVLSLFQWIRKYRAPLLHLRHKSAQAVRWKKRESMQW